MTTISLLVPVGGDDPYRAKSWEWLHQYWQNELPNAEIVIGRDKRSEGTSIPFSKTTAVNEAFKRSNGDVIVILDSDAFVRGESLTHCAEHLQEDPQGWFVPFNELYRLSPRASDIVMASDPCNPFRLPYSVVQLDGSVAPGFRLKTPPEKDPDDKSDWGPAEAFGAMCIVLHRDAFISVGGMDSRFRGWGGEDVSMVYILNTLWGPMRTTDNDLYHLWHPHHRAGDGTPWSTLMWDKQSGPLANITLYNRYLEANGDPRIMRNLIDEDG